MKTSKKNVKLNQLNQANGQLTNEKEITKIDQIFGDTGISRYSTLKEDEYLSHLNEMNKSDLFAHAAKLGIMPIDNRERLVTTLLKEFRIYISAYNRPKFNVPQPRPVSKEVSKILAEGR